MIRNESLRIWWNEDGSIGRAEVSRQNRIDGIDYPLPTVAVNVADLAQYTVPINAAVASERDALAAQVQSLTAELQSLLNSQASMLTDRDDYAIQAAKVPGLQADKSSLESQRVTLTGERDALQAQLSTITAERDSLFADLSVAQSDISRLTSERDSVTSERDTHAQRIAELESQLDALLPPGPDLTTRDGVRQFVSNARYVAETGGIYLGDQFISTERDEIGHWFPRFYNALMWINGDGRIRAGNPDGLYPFKPKGHAPTVLSAEQVLRAYECLAWFINACFAAEAVLYGRLEANEPLDVIVTATETAWPSNHFTWEPQ